jgi:hypothetical protein
MRSTTPQSSSVISLPAQDRLAGVVTDSFMSQPVEASVSVMPSSNLVWRDVLVVLGHDLKSL